MKRPKDPELPLVCARHWDRDKFEVFDPAEGVIMVDPRSLDRRGYLAPMILRGNNVRMRVEDKSFVEIEGQDPTAKARAEGKRTSLTRKINYETLRRYLFICHGTDPDDPKLIAFLENHDMRRPQKAPTNEELIQMYHEVYESVYIKVAERLDAETKEAFQRRFTESFPNAPQVDTAKIREMWEDNMPFSFYSIELIREVGGLLQCLSGDALKDYILKASSWVEDVRAWAPAIGLDPKLLSMIFQCGGTTKALLSIRAADSLAFRIQRRLGVDASKWPINASWNSKTCGADILVADRVVLTRTITASQQFQAIQKSFEALAFTPRTIVSYKGRAQGVHTVESMLSTFAWLKGNKRLPAPKTLDSPSEKIPAHAPRVALTPDLDNVFDFQAALDEAAELDAAKANQSESSGVQNHKPNEAPVV
jgi:hypothetical protein